MEVGEGTRKHAHARHPGKQAEKEKKWVSIEISGLSSPTSPLLAPDFPARSRKPICSHRGKESLDFSITMILTKTSSNK